MAVNQVATLGVKVDPRGAVTGAKRARTAIQSIGKTANNVKNRIMSVQGALLGLGAGAFLKSVITTASSVESLQIRLKFLTNTTEEAAQAFQDMNTFASKVPFSLEEIERASPLLLTVAKDASELNNLLAITGDIAAVSGLSFEATAGQLQRAMAGGIAAADMFREKGVKAFLGFKEGVQYNAEQTKQIIEDIWKNSTSTAVGATEALADSFVGQTSMMGDAFRNLKLAVADSGVFELTAKAVQKITALMNSEETVENMKKFGGAIVTVGKALGAIIDSTLALPKWILEVGIVMAILGGKKGKLIVAGLIGMAAALDKITDAYKEFKSVPNAYMDLNKDLDAAQAKFVTIKTKVDLAKKAINEYHNAERIGIATDDQYAAMRKGMDYVIKVTPNLQRAKDKIDEIKGALDDLDTAFKAGTFSTVGEISTSMLGNIKVTLEETEALSDAIVIAADSFDYLTKRADNFFHPTSIMARGINIVRDGFHGMLNVIKDTTIAMDKSIHPTQIMGAEFDRLAKIAKESQIKIEEFANGVAQTIEDSIVKMVQGLMTFKDVVKSVFAFVAQELVRSQIAQPMADAVKLMLTGGKKGITGNPHKGSSNGFLQDVFGGLGLFANGGRPPVGVPSIVGERGAELFVPDSAGTVVPNNQMGGQTINVTYSPQVNALDPRTAQAVIAENATTIIAYQ